MKARSPLPRPAKPIRRTRIKAKKTSALKMKQGLDLVFKDLIHERDGWRCLRCGTDKQLQAAHVKPKGKYPRLRFNPLNLLTLCWHDHMGWAHKDPLGFTRWFDLLFPGRAALLDELDGATAKLDIKDMYERLKPEIERLKAEMKERRGD